jgi:quercetin dioxygenase-like cupin family protein
LEISLKDVPLGDLAELCRRTDAITVLEGDEVAFVYFQSTRLSFAAATLNAGQSTPIDPGHPSAHEILYCHGGHVRVSLGDQMQAVELQAGDGLLIYDGVPHQVTALTGPAELIWCAAPSWGRDVITNHDWDRDAAAPPSQS